MNYLIVSPVRSGSTWLNLTLAKHLNLTNIGEALCKISPTLLMNSNINLTSQLANNNTDLPVQAKTANRRFVKAISPPAKNIVFIVPARIAITPPNKVKTIVVTQPNPLE